MTPLETELTAHLKVALSELAYWHAGWRAEPVLLYSEKGIEGWEWTNPEGETYRAIGDWCDPPPLPRLKPVADSKASQLAAFLDSLIHLES